MAYLLDIRSLCQKCHRPAVVRLFNDVNALLGEYCRQHGDAALRRQQDTEDRARAERLG